MTDQPNSSSDLRALHDAAYFESFTPPYRFNSEVWQGHFSRAAKQVIDTLSPTSVLDVGCALGVLVHQFNKRGIPARGLDVSDVVLEPAEPIQGLLFQHDLREPIPETADTVICIEVMEHLPEESAASAVKNLCDAAGRYVIFSSTSEDNETEVHVNVRDQEYWDALFSENGFLKREDLDVRNFCPWAVVYERTAQTIGTAPTTAEREEEKSVEEITALLQAAAEDTVAAAEPTKKGRSRQTKS